ncbi:MAG: hypothetical protein GYB55_24740 [Cytophagales bacterium]|uniref:hypothetical protein n=1 Tax=Cyclobacterium marinum TaxID=104 RepID=UPI0030D9F692|nr:hypothetical protein [Cytophagales bacterium]|tara:strand:- start:1067 stop:1774 length:708 start_codon:yes stop_codon:yes gene_type:complete
MKTKILEKAKHDLPLYFDDFKEFWDQSIDNIEDDDLYEAYRATLVFKNWKYNFHSIELKSFDQILDEIYEDINSSFFLAILGLYRSAHMHMRSSIELSLQLVYFIHHPIELEKWKNGDFVIKHSDLCQYIVDHPVFETDIQPLITNITKNWKHFSKHIHGESPIFFQSEKDARKTNSFTEKDFGIWKSNFFRNIYRINKLLCLFLKNEINRFPENPRNLVLELLKEEDLELIFKE